MWFPGRIAGAFLWIACVAGGVSPLQAQTLTDPPLSTGEKWEFGTVEVFDPLAILDLGAGAALRQQQDQFPTFGQGVFGYTKRYGVAFANHAGSDYMTGSIFPILLKEDPRYFRKAEGGFFRRFFYAASRIPVTRTDKGKNRFNFSEIIGNAAAATLSNVYLPHGDRTPSYSAQTFALFLGSDALVNIAKEFWPNVRHKLFHGPPAGGSAPPSPQGLAH
jgi:hypothetical protein